MFYVGVSHYFATGEGVTLYVASGSEETIRDYIPEYFHKGLTLLTPSEWLIVANSDSSDEYQQSDADLLQYHLPVLWKQIEELALGRGCHLEFTMTHRFNYS